MASQDIQEQQLEKLQDLEQLLKKQVEQNEQIKLELQANKLELQIQQKQLDVVKMQLDLQVHHQELQQKALASIRQDCSTSAFKLLNIEHRQSHQSSDPKEAMRHVESFYQGGAWTAPEIPLQALAEAIEIFELPSDKGAQEFATGSMALQNDQRRGVFYATQQWLVSTGQLDEKSDQLQGKVLPWLPAFQAEMIKQGVPESFFQGFKSPQLTEIQQAWRKASEYFQAVPEAGASFQKVDGAEDVDKEGGEAGEGEKNETAGDKSFEDESSESDEVDMLGQTKEAKKALKDFKQAAEEEVAKLSQASQASQASSEHTLMTGPAIEVQDEDSQMAF